MSRLAINDPYSNLPITKRNVRTRADDGRLPEDAPEWIYQVDNPYLHGVYAPTTVELSTDDLEVEGEIPENLYGAYMRNGPNPEFKPKHRYHPFDGDGMVAAIFFRDGQAYFANRWIETRALKKEREAGEAIWPGVMGPFNFDLPDFPIKDTSNTDLLYYNGNIITLWYMAGLPYTLNPQTLETTGVEKFHGDFRRALSAHSKVDWATGELIFFDYWDEPPYMSYGIADSTGHVVHHTDIELPGARSPHDIGFTENYVILHDLPFFHDVNMLHETGKRVAHFHREIPARFGINPRYESGDKVKWFDCEPCYILHIVNCWEEGDWVIMDGCRSTNPWPEPDRSEGELAGMLSYMRLEANMYRWKFNMKTGEVVEHDICTLNTEFPRINPLYGGVKSKYSYNQYIMTAPQESRTLAFGGLIKYDTESGGYERYNYGREVFGSEASFAPGRGNTRDDPEDDGYLITFTTDAKTWKSACLIFDATNIKQGPVARVYLPLRLPAGFHSNWIRGEDIWK